MIVQAYSSLYLLVFKGIISLLPTFDSLPSMIVDTIQLLVKAMKFFPSDVWALVIGNVVFWTGVHLIVGLVKFILGFVPTMDGG